MYPKTGFKLIPSYFNCSKKFRQIISYTPMENIYDGKFFTFSTHQFKAFSSPKMCKNILIYITGLEGNLLSDNLSKFIYKFCIKHNFTFVQPILRSHPNFGLYTLEDDALELGLLFDLFAENKLILVGSSTGCQNIIYTLNKKNYKNVVCAILQGPVSDREYEEDTVEYKETLEKINLLHDEECFVYKKILYNKTRWLDLYKKGGRDDIFSSDLLDSHYISLNEKMYKYFFVICKNDEYCKKSNKNKLKLVKNSTVYDIDGADHFMSKNVYLEHFELILNEALKSLFLL